MKSRAAVAWDAGKPLVIEEVEVAGPKEGEVLLKVAATGVCHTDAYTLSGKDPEGFFPAIMGHEGGAVVMEIGAGVTSVKPGDHVIPLYIPECGKCKFCQSGRTNLCGAIRLTQGKGVMPDGTSRFSLNGKTVLTLHGHIDFFGIHRAAGNRGRRKSIQRRRWTKFVCSAAVSLRVSARFSTPRKCDPAQRRRYSASGGIGLSVIQGLVMAKAERIIAVDTNHHKFEMAKNLGRYRLRRAARERPAGARSDRRDDRWRSRLLL